MPILRAAAIALLAVAGVQAQTDAFAFANITPSVIPTFNPSGTLRITYQGAGDVTAGQQLAPSQLRSPPAIFYTSFSGQSNAASKYLLITIDPDAPTPSNPNRSNIIHWTVSNLVVSNTSQLMNGTEVARYNGPGPPAGSPAHRYIFLLYAQPSNFTLPANVSTLPNMIGGNRLNFNLTSFVANTGLGSPVGGNFLLSSNDGTSATSGASASFLDSATIGGSQTMSGNTASATAMSMTSSSMMAPTSAPVSSRTGDAISLKVRGVEAIAVGVLAIAALF